MQATQDNIYKQKTACCPPNGLKSSSPLTSMSKLPWSPITGGWSSMEPQNEAKEAKGSWKLFTMRCFHITPICLHYFLSKEIGFKVNPEKKVTSVTQWHPVRTRHILIWDNVTSWLLMWATTVTIWICHCRCHGTIIRSCRTVNE